ncbi:LamG domain-containing protein [Fuerstiella marisgermanici]|uniref:Laminin G domain-containing protein n=1 Tax=Fuerstiella marisgermanici TaxID=1891926 RepID=A0A1P8WDL5_9PLAN|nr:LamG domain-containing protein [Fuerstiella marisgermanici]APZ92155.1 hypothetical protein Fuma_01763 [Fuerstiella marisgermanici]
MRFSAVFAVCVLFHLSASPLHADVIAKWDFDQGDLTDSSGNGYHLDHFNQFFSLTFGQGRNGLAPIFTNADYLYSRNADLYASRSEFTIGGWVRSAQTQGSDSYLFMNGDDSGFNHLNGGVTLHFDTLYGYVGSGGNHLGSSGTGITVNDDLWHHVALVLDTTLENDMRLYFDGELITQKNSSFGSTEQGNIFTIGGKALGNRTATGRGFTGMIDEVFFADHALSTAEVQDIAGISAIPEPGSCSFLALAAGAFLVMRRRKALT